MVNVLRPQVPSMGSKTTPSSAVHKPISLAGRKGRKNEIFVDILERLNVLFNSNVRGGSGGGVVVAVVAVVRAGLPAAAERMDVRRVPAQQ